MGQALFLWRCPMKLWLLVLFSLSVAGCTSSKCANDSGCDTAVAEEEEESGPVSVDASWQSGALLIVNISGMGSGTLGLAETGIPSGGWFSEDCITAGRSFCHDVQDGSNSFVSVNKRATGVAWDGEMDNNETLMHQEGEANITWAVFDSSGSCVGVGGHDPEYYSSSGCVNL
jgi:hypothetical protein